MSFYFKDKNKKFPYKIKKPTALKNNEKLKKNKTRRISYLFFNLIKSIFVIKLNSTPKETIRL